MIYEQEKFPVKQMLSLKNKFLLIVLFLCLAQSYSCAQNFEVESETITVDFGDKDLSPETDTNYFIDVGSIIPMRFYSKDSGLANDFSILLNQGLSPEAVFYGFNERLNLSVVDTLTSSFYSKSFIGAIIIIRDIEVLEIHHDKFQKALKVFISYRGIEMNGDFLIPFDGLESAESIDASIELGEPYNFMFEL